MTSPTFAFSPFFLRTRVTVPAAGAGSSTVTLSVSMTTTAPSFSTAWPSGTSPSPICTSVMDSPTDGTFSSIGIDSPRLGDLLQRTQGAGEDLVLLQLVAARGAGRRARGRLATDLEQGVAAERGAPEAQAHVPPRAHVLRFLLDPHARRSVRVRREGPRERVVGQRIELLDAHQRDVLARERRSALLELERDLAAAQEHAIDPRRAGLRVRVPRVREDPVEASARELVEARHDLGVAEQALRRHDDERLPPRPPDLAPEAVEELRGRREVDDLDVVLGGLRQESLEPRARMLRTLAFQAVRQEQG